jgi:hypothetical protein
MMREQVLGQGVAFNPGKCCESSNNAMGVGMEKGQEISAKGLVLLLCRPRDFNLLEQRRSSCASIARRRQMVTGNREVSVHSKRIESEEESLGP